LSQPAFSTAVAQSTLPELVFLHHIRCRTLMFRFCCLRLQATQEMICLWHLSDPVSMAPVSFTIHIKPDYSTFEEQIILTVYHDIILNVFNFFLW